MQIHCKTHIFEGLAGCVRERKRYQTKIKNAFTIHPKFDKNQCKPYIRKHSVTQIEIHRKWSRKGNPKS